MDDFGVPLFGFLSTLIGAALGFFGLRWQNRAQKQHEIRSKGADLIFLGDQHRSMIKRPGHMIARPITLREAPVPSLSEVRLDQMHAIVRYLELVASPKTYVLASKFRMTTENLSPTSASEGQTERQFVAARDELIRALKRK